MLMYSCFCFCPLTHLQSEKKKKKDSYLSPLKTIFVSWHHDWHRESVLPLPKCLHINACPRIIWPHRNIHPHPVSDVGPVPPVRQAATGVIAYIKSTSRSFLYLHLHSPIGEKLFLYVNHRREVTSDKISSFSKEKSQIMLIDDYFIICVCVFCIKTCKCTVLFP